MSGLYLLALIALWVLLTWLMYRLWRVLRPAGRVGKIVHAAIGAVVIGVWLSGSFWEAAGKKMYWDARVRLLCAKNGGIRVYERVRLPTSQFNRWGQINFYRPTQGANALGSKFAFIAKTHYLKRTNPQVSRRTYRVYRRSDQKLLGEVVVYGRGGGDFPGPWHESNFRCPRGVGENSLFKEVFIQTTRER